MGLELCAQVTDRAAERSLTNATLFFASGSRTQQYPASHGRATQQPNTTSPPLLCCCPPHLFLLSHHQDVVVLRQLSLTDLLLHGAVAAVNINMQLGTTQHTTHL